jgi:hypothetical protein
MPAISWESRHLTVLDSNNAIGLWLNPFKSHCFGYLPIVGQSIGNPGTLSVLDRKDGPLDS